MKQKHYSIVGLLDLTVEDIEKLKINKIVWVSNFDDEMVSDRVHAEKVEPYLLVKTLTDLYSSSGPYSRYYPVAVQEDYELYKFEP